MKKYLLLILALSGIALAASFDRRSNNQNQGEPVFRVDVPQMTIPAANTTEQTETINLNGVIQMVVVYVNDNTNNSTIDVEIRNDNNAVLWVENAIAENATTVFKYMTESATELNLRVPVTGTLTVSASPSAAPGASTATVDIILYGE